MKNHAQIIYETKKKKNEASIDTNSLESFFLFSSVLLANAFPKDKNVGNKLIWSIPVFWCMANEIAVDTKYCATACEPINFRLKYSIFAPCHTVSSSMVPSSWYIHCRCVMCTEHTMLLCWAMPSSSANSIDLIFHEFQRITLKASRRDMITLSCPRSIWDTRSARGEIDMHSTCNWVVTLFILERMKTRRKITGYCYYFWNKDVPAASIELCNMEISLPTRHITNHVRVSCEIAIRCICEIANSVTLDEIEFPVRLCSILHSVLNHFLTDKCTCFKCANKYPTSSSFSDSTSCSLCRLHFAF